jgi:hypothetical protein
MDSRTPAPGTLSVVCGGCGGLRVHECDPTKPCSECAGTGRTLQPRLYSHAELEAHSNLAVEKYSQEHAASAGALSIIDSIVRSRLLSTGSVNDALAGYLISELNSGMLGQQITPQIEAVIKRALSKCDRLINASRFPLRSPAPVDAGRSNSVEFDGISMQDISRPQAKLDQSRSEQSGISPSKQSAFVIDHDTMSHARDMVAGHYPSHREYKVALALLTITTTLEN